MLHFGKGAALGQRHFGCSGFQVTAREKTIDGDLPGECLRKF